MSLSTLLQLVRKLSSPRRALFSVSLLLTTASVLACSSVEPPSSGGGTDVALASSPALIRPGPAEIWARNCARCHNLQPPSRYSDSEWSVVMHHMRLRCYLTGEEQRAIEQFLRSANN